MFVVQKHLGCISLKAAGVQPLIGVVDPMVPGTLRTVPNGSAPALMVLPQALGILFQDISVSLCRNGCCSPSHAFVYRIHSPPQHSSQCQTRISAAASYCRAAFWNRGQRVRGGGCRNVLVVNYTLDSCIPPGGSATDACPPSAVAY